MKSSFKSIVSLVFLMSFVALLCSCNSKCYGEGPADKSESTGVKITELADKLRVEINGELFTEYRFADVMQPHFYPVVGPTGEIVVRRWPVEPNKDGKYELHDHKGHIGIWFGHPINHNGMFWCAGKVHDGFTEISSGKDVGVIRSKNKWVDGQGKTVCTDERVYRIYNKPDCRMLDYEITIHASAGAITFNDSKEGTMAIRLAPSLAVRLDGNKIASRFKIKRDPEDKGGHVLTSAGLTDDDAWGSAGAWCDYYGPLKGETVGAALFDHPSNPKHPTHWMVRDYGLLAANPFGLHDFKKGPFGGGAVTVAAGESVTFKYRFYFHKGTPQQANVADKYAEYIKESCK